MQLYDPDAKRLNHVSLSVNPLMLRGQNHPNMFNGISQAKAYLKNYLKEKSSPYNYNQLSITNVCTKPSQLAKVH